MSEQPTPEPAPAPAPAPAPQAPEGFVSKEVYDREVEDRKRERNLYKPYASTFGPLTPEQREAILGVAEMVAVNDTEGIVDWSLTTAENVSGKSHAELIAARQAQTPIGTPSTPGVPAATPAQPALSADEIRRMLADTIKEDRQQYQQQVSTQEQIRIFTAKMTEAGITPASDDGAEVIEMCRAFRGDMDKALRMHKLAKQDAAAAAAAAALAAGQTPAPAPNGTPAPNAPADGLTHRERV